MSTDLVVRLIRPIDLTEFVGRVEEAIREVFDIASFPPLYVLEPRRGAWDRATSGSIASDGQEFLIKVAGLDEAVDFVVTDIPHHSTINKEDVGLWATISVAAMRTPLEFALAACVSIVLAQLNNTTIIDDARRWSNSFKQSPTELTKSLKVQGPFDDIREPAMRIFARITSRTAPGD